MPPRLRSAGCRFGIRAKQQGGNAGMLGGQCKPAAGGEIDHAHIVRCFDHHGAQSGTTQAIASRLEQCSRIIRKRQDQPRRIKAKFSQTSGMQPSMPRLGCLKAKHQDR